MIFRVLFIYKKTKKDLPDIIIKRNFVYIVRRFPAFFPEEEIMKRYTIPMIVIAMMLFFTGASFAEIRVVSVKGTASYKAGG